MYFANQQEYEQYYSTEQRLIRTAQAKTIGEQAISEALTLSNLGDKGAARQRLFDAGIPDDGISYYIQLWRG